MAGRMGLEEEGTPGDGSPLLMEVLPGPEDVMDTGLRKSPSPGEGTSTGIQRLRESSGSSDDSGRSRHRSPRRRRRW